jgi:two-component system nitrogen regulation sensor histidine kinase NtrY
LIKNAKEAQLSKVKVNKVLDQGSHKDIEVQVFKSAQQVIIKVLDQGCGIANPSNLFVPFILLKKQALVLV